MNGTDLSIDERIRSFASSVRGHLDDLPSDELDEIIGGLVADLTDQAADNEGTLDLGDPAEYAAELRAAAGLPPRDARAQRASLGVRLRAWRSRTAVRIRLSPVGAWLLDLLIALRPVWWVLRGYGVYVVLLFLITFGRPRNDQLIVPDSFIEWGAVAVLVIVSVQWGRGDWLPGKALRHVRTVASILAVIALIPAIPIALSPRTEYVYASESVGIPGLALDGVQINNIFAYDADGNPIDHVQLFTGKGTPLNLYGEAGGEILFSEDGEQSEFGIHDTGTHASVPSKDYRGRPVWNIYPLDEAPWDPMTAQPDLDAAEQPAPPFPLAPSIDAAGPTPSPTPTPSQPVETPAP